MLMSINMVEMNAIHVFPNIQTVNLAAQTHARHAITDITLAEQHVLKANPTAHLISLLQVVIAIVIVNA